MEVNRVLFRPCKQFAQEKNIPTNMLNHQNFKEIAVNISFLITFEGILQMTNQQTAIITGGSKGIGRACVQKFLEENFTVFSCARDIAPFQDLQQAFPKRLYPSICDVSKKNELTNWLNLVKSQTNQIDVLINNAGVFFPGNLMDESSGHLEKMIETNLYSTYHTCREIVPIMKNQKNGHIFNMCSIAALQAYPQGGSYSISKFAQYGFTKNLRYELKNDNIKVSAVLPGATHTDSWIESTLPKERFIQSKDLARLIWSCFQNNEFAVVEDLIVRPQLGDV